MPPVKKARLIAVDIVRYCQGLLIEAAGNPGLSVDNFNRVEGCVSALRFMSQRADTPSESEVFEKAIQEIGQAQPAAPASLASQTPWNNQLPF